MKAYHCFYIEPVGLVRKYVVHTDEAKVLDLVKAANPAPHEHSNVADLVVIYGEKLEFEPAEWVKSFKIKGEG